MFTTVTITLSDSTTHALTIPASTDGYTFVKTIMVGGGFWESTRTTFYPASQIKSIALS